MAFWDTIKAVIDAAITDNNSGQITGLVLNAKLKEVVDALGVSQYRGSATPTTVPIISDGPIFYFASTNGTYSNFSSLVVTDELVVLSNSTGSWSKTQILDISVLGGSDTAEQLRDKLETLTVDDRLDASAIKNLPTGSGISQTELEDYLEKSGYPTKLIIEHLFADDITGWETFNGSSAVSHDNINDRLVIDNTTATGAAHSAYAQVPLVTYKLNINVSEGTGGAINVLQKWNVLVGVASEGDNEFTWTQDAVVDGFSNNIILDPVGSGETYVNSFQLYEFNTEAQIYTKVEVDAQISTELNTAGFISAAAIDAKIARDGLTIYGNNFEDVAEEGIINVYQTVTKNIVGGELVVNLGTANAAICFGPRLDFEPFNIEVILDVEILDNAVQLRSNWSESESTSIFDITTSGRYHILLTKLNNYSNDILERVLLRSRDAIANTNFNIRELRVEYWPDEIGVTPLSDQLNGSSVVLGNGAISDAGNQVVIGQFAEGGVQKATAVGAGARAIYTQFYTAADSLDCAAFGNDAVAHGWRTTALGGSAHAAGQSSVAIGAGAVARGTHGVAIGRGALNPSNDQGGQNATVHANGIIYFENGWGHKFNLPDSGISIGDRIPIDTEIELHGYDAFDSRFPLWDIATTYAIGDYRQHSNKVYKALTASTGQQPDISPTDWLYMYDTANGGPSDFNVAGGHMALHAGKGTGTANGGELRFYSAPSVGAGENSKNPSKLAMKITSETASELSDTGTRLYLLDISNNTIYRVQIGANDSGGTGKRILVIDNN